MPLVGPYENKALKTTGGDNQMIGDAWLGHGIFIREARDARKRALKAVPREYVPKINDLSEKNLDKDRFQYPSSRQNMTLYLGDAEGYLSMMDLFKQRSLTVRLGPSRNKFSS